MLRSFRTPARPTTICTRWCRSRHRRLLQPPQSRPQQSRDHYKLQHRVYSNYAPQQLPPIYSYAPPSRWSRLKDMAIGSALTIGAYLAWRYYDYRQFSRQLSEHTQRMEEMTQMVEEFEALMAEARDAGDEVRMREILFERHRRMAGTEEEDTVEAGPLPGFPADHELFAKEKVPVEDTLMFINYTGAAVETPGGNQSQAQRLTPDSDLYVDPYQYTAVSVAVNTDARSPGFGHFRSGAAVSVNPQQTKLQELLWRFENQVKTWRKEGTIGVHEDLVVIFVLRDAFFGFLYVNGQFESIVPDFL